MNIFVSAVVNALSQAGAMAWSVLWSLVLGFLISALIQALVSQRHMQTLLGGRSPRAMALAAAFGAASSSCSYASAAISRSLLARGASAESGFAFLIASTNLVIELGLVLWILMGWQFTLAEWLGGCVMILIMAGLLRVLRPAGLIAEARAHATEAMGHSHAAQPVAGETLAARLRNPDLPVRVAQSFAADIRMVWKDIALGFLIAGALAALVPAAWWSSLFLHDAPPWLRIPLDALLAPLIAVVSFVCSIGNVPMAAVLWHSGVGFGGVLAFLYADLIVLPLIDVYRRAYGGRAALGIVLLLYVTMVLSGLVMHLGFAAADLIPPRSGGALAPMSAQSWITTAANLAALAVASGLFALSARHPAVERQCCGH